MKLPVSWLNEYTQVSKDLSALADSITMNGLEIEDVYTLSGEDFTLAGGTDVSEICWDVKVTPNRGDWLSMLGVAREVAIVTKNPITFPKVIDILEGSCPVKINIKTDKCKRYLGAVIRNIKLGESPDYIKNRLIAAGMRPINNIVDITNYVMLELGQPLHAFDLRLISGNEINIRPAYQGETIKTLDDIDRELDTEMTVIADRDIPVALAGIMGGAGSEIKDDTADVFLETAIFDCYNVRRTSKKLNLSTESSYRFERTVDEELASFAAKRALSLIQELTGGKIDGGLEDVYPNKRKPLIITSNPNRINTLLGMNISPEEMAECLNTGHIPTKLENNLLLSTIPAFRTDLTKAIDMVEEVGRVYGYNKIGMTLPKTNNAGKQSETGLFHLKLRQLLLSMGGQEILTHSMVNSEQNQFAKNISKEVIIRNPLSSELDAMRLMLIPNILEILSSNQSHQESDINLFEIAKIYFYNQDNIIDEKFHVAGALIGNSWNNSWGINCKDCQVDFFTVKALIETLLDNLGISNVEYKRCQREFLHPTRCAEVFANGIHIGIFGEASKSISDYTKIRGRAYIYELDFNTLKDMQNQDFKYTAIDKFPAIKRHISITVDKATIYSDIEKTAWTAASDIIKEIKLIDVFESEKLGNDKKSLTIEILMRADRTLTDEEANSASDNIRKALETK